MANVRFFLTLALLLLSSPAMDSLPLSPIADIPLPGNASRFDPGLRRLYAASEPGTVAVFVVASDHTVTEIGRGVVAPGAHSVAVDPATHRVYFPIANLGGRPVLKVMDARVVASTP